MFKNWPVVGKGVIKMSNLKRLVKDLMEGASVRDVIESNKRVSTFPEKIFILNYPSTNKGYVYTKDYAHENGGCYYSADANSSPVDGGFISLYPDGHLTFLWNGVEKPYNHDWFEVCE